MIILFLNLLGLISSNNFKKFLGDIMEKILIVDDDLTIRRMLRRHLTGAGYEVSEAENGKMALEEIKINLPDVVILDVMMPDMTGFQVCQKLLDTPQSDLVYIIMLTAIAGSEHKVRGLDQGADDYVTKPFDIDELLARIRLGLRSIQKRRGAIIDALSELYTRDFFNLYLVQEVERAQRYKRQLSLILIDLDHFKQINDTYGHLVGDSALAQTSRILRMHCRETDIPVRWGGEEFAILLPETDLAGAIVFAERLRQAIEAYQFETAGHITASFGVTGFNTDEQDLLTRADAALYKAKKEGRNRVVSSE